MSEVVIKVIGLNEFRKGLRGMDRSLPKAVREVLNTAAQTLIDAAQPKVPKRSGAARASMRAQSTQTVARVAVGGTKAPYFPWLDFGGRVGRRKSVVRPFYREGRYVYPTLAEKREEIQDVMLQGLVKLASDNGVEVT